MWWEEVPEAEGLTTTGPSTRSARAKARVRVSPLTLPLNRSIERIGVLVTQHRSTI